jgi:hypothetical protein
MKPSLLELAERVRAVASKMRYTVAGGMMWIDHNEAEDFATRLDGIADDLAALRASNKEQEQ